MDNIKGYLKQAEKDIRELEDFIAASEAICKQLDDKPKELTVILASLEKGTKAVLKKVEGLKSEMDKDVYKRYIKPHVSVAYSNAARVLETYKPKK